MFVYGLIIIEILFFAYAIAYVLRENAPEYKVSKDIWGVYQQPELAENNSVARKEQSMVLVFSKYSTSVNVLSCEDSFDPSSPKGSPSNRKAA
jgi:hypothetical protein